MQFLKKRRHFQRPSLLLFLQTESFLPSTQKTYGVLSNQKTISQSSKLEQDTLKIGILFTQNAKIILNTNAWTKALDSGGGPNIVKGPPYKRTQLQRLGM